MGELDDRVQANDARGAFKRVGGAHERLDIFGIGKVALEFDEALDKRGELGLGLGAVKVEQAEVEL